MSIKVKKLHPEASLPTKAHEGDAGWDIKAISMQVHPGYIEYGTGLAIVVPKGTVGLLFPRSSISKKALTLANSVGVLDPIFLGEVTFRFRYENFFQEDHVYKIGDKIGQLVVTSLPDYALEEVQVLENTDRGTGAYGSSGH